jgi:hypothetical protein
LYRDDVFGGQTSNPGVNGIAGEARLLPNLGVGKAAHIVGTHEIG